MRRTLINEFKNTPWGKKYVFGGFSDCAGTVAGRLKAEERERAKSGKLVEGRKGSGKNTGGMYRN